VTELGQGNLNYRRPPIVCIASPINLSIVHIADLSHIEVFMQHVASNRAHIRR